MGRMPHYSFRGLMMLALIGFSYTGMGLGGIFLGASDVGPGIATVLANAQPLFAAILSLFVLKEVITVRLYLGLFIGFVGVVILALPGFDVGADRSIGALYALGGAVGTAIGNVLLKHQAGDGDVYWPMGIQLVMGAVFLFLASLLAGGSNSGINRNQFRFSDRGIRCTFLKTASPGRSRHDRRRQQSAAA